MKSASFFSIKFGHLRMGDPCFTQVPWGIPEICSTTTSWPFGRSPPQAVATNAIKGTVE